MLKPAGGTNGPGGDKSLGELAQQVLDDGKSYLHAEANLLRAKAEVRLEQYRHVAILAGAAAAVGLATLVAFAVAVVIALAWLIGVVVGSLLAVLLFAAIAVGLGYAAKRAWSTIDRDDVDE